MAYGPYIFTSGYNPQRIEGPQKRTYTIEHKVPGSEGGVVEYIGSEQNMYQIRGFISAPQDGPATGNAAGVLSGTSYVGVGGDQAAQTLFALRGSGAQLLRIESTTTQYSGYMNLFENDFYFIEQVNLSYEPGHGYPYYPFNLRLRRASPGFYGNGSGTATFSGLGGAYFSGYIYAFNLQVSGVPRGEAINTLGVYVNSVASGNLKVAVYSGTSMASGSNKLSVQSASQPVHSGWNYFPVRPGFITVSGTNYILAFAGDATSTSGFVVAQLDTAGLPFDSGVESGIGFSSAFPTTFAQLSGNNNSGLEPDIVMVTA
jgi:hypothetical protein